MRKKTWLAILAAAVMLCALLPVAALAADGTIFTSDGIRYRIIDDTAKKVEVIHSTANDDVSNLPDSTYSGSVTIPAKVTSDTGVEYSVVGIDAMAFIGAKIDSITLNEGLEYIDSGAFQSSTLTSIVIPASVKRLATDTNSGLFHNSPIESVTFAQGSQLTEIGRGAFSNCNELLSLEIPAGVTELYLEPQYPFMPQPSLVFGWHNTKNISFAEGSPYINDNGVLYKDTTLFRWLDSEIQTLHVKAGTTAIKDKALYNCKKLETIVLPDGLETIGNDAFSLSSNALTFINIPSTVTSIGNNFLKGALKLDGTSTILMQGNTPPQFGTSPLNGIDKTSGVTILYPAEAEAAYRASGLSSYLPSPGSPDEDQTAYALNIPATLSLDVNQSTSLTAACKVPQGTRLVVSLSDPTVVSIDLYGTITGIKSGSATVTVSIATAGGITLDTKTCTITVNHVHAPAKTEAAAPTCAQNGHTAYWYCADCQKYFADAACTREIALADTVIPATGAHQYQNGLCTVCGARDTSTPPAAQPPKTGDDSRLALWTLLLIAAAIGLAGAALYRKGKATR